MMSLFAVLKSFIKNIMTTKSSSNEYEYQYTVEHNVECASQCLNSGCG